VVCDWIKMNTIERMTEWQKDLSSKSKLARTVEREHFISYFKWESTFIAADMLQFLSLSLSQLYACLFYPILLLIWSTLLLNILPTSVTSYKTGGGGGNISVIWKERDGNKYSTKLYELLHHVLRMLQISAVCETVYLGSDLNKEMNLNSDKHYWLFCSS
jgi:hypothetical protein